MATYTNLDLVDLPAVTAYYGIELSAAEPLKGGFANSSFCLNCAEGDFVLTALDNHDPQSAAQLARWTRLLFRAGLPTAEVIAGMDGKDTLVAGERPFILKKMIPGHVVDPLPPDQMPAAGRLLARLHGISDPDLDLPVGTRRLSESYRALIEGFPDQAFVKWLTDHLAEIDRKEAAHHRDKVPVHGDLFADNLIVGPDGSLSIIDWETVTLDDPLLDLGMAAVGICQDEAGCLSMERLCLLLQGYCDERPLGEESLADLPLEIIHAAVIIAFHRYYRHNVRFPNPDCRDFYKAMIGFVESVPEVINCADPRGSNSC